MRVGVSKLETSLLTHFMCQISTLFFFCVLPPVSIRLPPSPGSVEGGKMGGGGGHEQHTSSAPGLHGSRLTDTATGIYVPKASH